MMSAKERLLKKAANVRKETAEIEFKGYFDPKSKKAWCEIVKDIAAIANSGGGIILFGIENNGTASGEDVRRILSLEGAKVTDQMGKYTDKQFSDFEIGNIKRGDSHVAYMWIDSVRVPLVFTKAGTYDIGGGKQESAFSRGSVYFRHGAKSEPGTTDDLKQAIDREVGYAKKFWISGIRKVVTAPPGHRVEVFPPEVRSSDDPSAAPIRICEDSNAPIYGKLDTDISHPYRQKEAIEAVNQKLKLRKGINQHDIQCIRRVYDIEGRQDFFHKPKFSSPQYSQKFVDWLIVAYERNHKFFAKVRKLYKGGKQKRYAVKIECAKNPEPFKKLSAPAGI